nr:GNAT family N-acetyltransferase [Actinacidiphila yeochonensis]
MTADPGLRAPLSVRPHPVAAPESQALLRRYYTELVSRYHGRPTDDAEVSAVLAEEPSDDLTRPTGEFTVARLDGIPVGCAGVRAVSGATVELTRVYVAPEARRRGVASVLVAAAEELAREAFGASRMRLDTRRDLVEARALYARLGYQEVAAFNRSPYADHWFEKPLSRT